MNEGEVMDKNSRYIDMVLLSKVPTKMPLRLNQLFHTLTGKRTASNLYQAQLFGLLPIFSLIEKTTKAELEALIIKWANKGWVHLKDDSFYKSNEGGRVVGTFFSTHDYPASIEYGRYGKAVTLFWQRIQLIAQVVSNREYTQLHYFPIIQDREIQIWVKQWLKQSGAKLSSKTFGQELLTILSKLHNQQADFIARSLSGYQQIGLTEAQRASVFGYEKEIIDLRFQDALHHFFQLALNEPNQSLIHQIALLSDQDTSFGVSASTYQTIQLIQSGKTPQTVSQIRKLKDGTVWEHIVEWAILHPESNYVSLIPFDIYQKGSQMIQDNEDLSFADIKEKIDDIHFVWYRLIQIERNYLNEQQH